MDHFIASQQADEEADDSDQQVLSYLLISFLCAELSCQFQARRRSERRHYLTQPLLLPNPQVDTPWQCLLASRSDRGFITMMGFDVDTFEYILSRGFRAIWDGLVIRRSDTNRHGKARPGRRSLDAEGGLGLVLHYLSSTMSETSLQQIFALIPSTVSRYVSFGLSTLLKVLRKAPDAAIRWPQGEEFSYLNSLIIRRHPLLTGAFASIDGLNLPVQTSSDEDIKNVTYNGWLHAHFVSSVLVFSPEGTSLFAPSHSCSWILGVILSANLNAPGSWHDARVARPIYHKLRDAIPDNFYLVADSAFPRGAEAIAQRIKAPLRAGQCLEGTVQDINSRLAFDRQLLSFRQTAEWGNHCLKAAFGRLRVLLEIKHKNRRGNLLEVCIRAHSLRTRRIGHNQIQTVYVPQWQGEGAEFSDFTNLLFSEQRANDRVSQFHTMAIYE